MKKLFAAAILAASSTAANAVSIFYSNEFSGGDDTGGTLVGTFTDSVNGVLMTLDATGLGAGEFVSELYLNSKGNTLNASTPGVVALSDPFSWTYEEKIDGHKADGDGNFDYKISFGTNEGSRFDAGTVATWLFAGINLVDFAALSVGGPEGKTGFLSAIHLQGIGNGGSGWYSAGTSTVPFDTQLNPVPIPAAAWMFLGGLGLFRVLRGKQA